MRAAEAAVIVLVVLALLLLGALLAVSITLGRNPRSKKCTRTSDCPEGYNCQNNKCLLQEGGPCKNGSQCGDKMACIKGNCKYYDFVNKNKRVRFAGEGRRRALKRRRGFVAPNMPHLDVKARDIRKRASATRAHVHAIKPTPALERKLRGAYDEDLQPVLPLDENTEIADLTTWGQKTVYLTRKRGDLIIKDAEGQRVVTCKPHMDHVLGLGRGLFGLAGGVMFKYAENTWQEVNIPTRQVVHWSATQDSSCMRVQDLSYYYDLDDSMEVLKEGPTTDLRFYGRDIEEYVDIDEGTRRGITSRGDTVDNITSATFDKRGLVVINDDKRAKGVTDVRFVHGKIFYVAEL